MFLQSRALLSSAVRLNILGPYLAHQLLLFEVRDLLRRIAASDARAHIDARPEIVVKEESLDQAPQDWDWAWQDDGAEYVSSTWPLLEVIQGRHDQLHSRLFNS